MNKDDIILMADASGLSFYGMGKDREKFIHYLEAFANLVVAAKREAYLDAMMQSVDKAVDTAMALEREACARLCEAQGEYGWQQYADAIRARSQA